MSSTTTHTVTETEVPTEEDPNRDLSSVAQRPWPERYLTLAMDLISGLLLLGLLGMLGFSILARDVLHVPTPWLEEIATLVTIYAVAAASIGAWFRKAHIAIDIIPNMMSGLPRASLENLIILVSLAFLGLATYGAWEMVGRSANNKTTALALSFSWYYGGLVFGFGGMLFAAILQTLPRLFGSRGSTNSGEKS